MHALFFFNQSWTIGEWKLQIFMKELEIRIPSRSVKLHFKRNLGWGSNIVYCVTSKFESATELTVFNWLWWPGWRGRAWTCCNLVLNIWKAGLDWETDLTSALLSAPRRSGWWMASNQQQTDLPQETSPHHVYGNQHFSRDPLIATEGEGEGAEKQLDSPSFSAEKISRLSAVHWAEYNLQAGRQMAPSNNTVA